MSLILMYLALGSGLGFLYEQWESRRLVADEMFADEVEDLMSRSVDFQTFELFQEAVADLRGKSPCGHTYVPTTFSIPERQSVEAGRNVYLEPGLYNAFSIPDREQIDSLQEALFAIKCNSQPNTLDLD